jgi:hypothetical protein
MVMEPKNAQVKNNTYDCINCSFIKYYNVQRRYG